MRRNTIAILLLMFALALAAVAQNEPASTQNPQVPAASQSVPGQTVPPDQSVTPAMPASDQTPVSQNLSADQSAISQELIQHERDGWENAKAKNASYFSGLPDNVTAALPNGSTENKGDIETMVRKYGISDYNLSNFNVTFPSADRAQVTYTASFSGKGAGNETRQVTSEWQRDSAGNWQNIRVDFR